MATGGFDARIAERHHFLIHVMEARKGSNDLQGVTFVCKREHLYSIPSHGRGKRWMRLRIYVESPMGKYGSSCGSTGEYVTLAGILRVLNSGASFFFA